MYYCELFICFLVRLVFLSAPNMPLPRVHSSLDRVCIKGPLTTFVEVTIDKVNTRLLTLLKLQTTRYIKQ